MEIKANEMAKGEESQELASVLDNGYDTSHSSHGKLVQ